MGRMYCLMSKPTPPDKPSCLATAGASLAVHPDRAARPQNSAHLWAFILCSWMNTHSAADWSRCASAATDSDVTLAVCRMRARADVAGAAAGCGTSAPAKK